MGERGFAATALPLLLCPLLGEFKMANYIQHHGIIGQKWGVRRYQNSDGSYTSAGKARRNLAGGKNKNNNDSYPKLQIETRRTHQSETLKRARKENINDLSDKELQQYNNRLQLEQNFERLREDNYSRAQEFVAKNLTKAAFAAVTAYALPKLMDHGSEWVNALFNSRRYIDL